MADYREILSLQKDPAHARAIAQVLSGSTDMEWTDWELDFLDGIAARQQELTTRQGEKLVELRDQATWYTRVEGFSLRTLVARCHLCCDQLAPEDAAFIERLEAAKAARLRRKDARRLLRCARTLGEIEPYQGGSLDQPRAD
jgi:hypothetical protein